MRKVSHSYTLLHFRNTHKLGHSLEAHNFRWRTDSRLVFNSRQPGRVPLTVCGPCVALVSAKQAERTTAAYPELISGKAESNSRHLYQALSLSVYHPFLHLFLYIHLALFPLLTIYRSPTLTISSFLAFFLPLFVFISISLSLTLTHTHTLKGPACVDAWAGGADSSSRHASSSSSSPPLALLGYPSRSEEHTSELQSR